MKKFFAFFIACILVMQFTFIPASAEGAEYEPYLKGVQETGSYVGDIEELRYYSFRYTKDASFAWFRENVIGPNHCKEGYLYVKDLVKEEIRQVSTAPIKAYERIGDDLFYANQSNEIVRTGVSTLEQTVVYKADKDVTSMCYDEDTLYFASGDTVMALNADSENVEEVAVCDGISELYMNSDGRLVWEDADGEAYAHDLVEGTDVQLERRPVIDNSQDLLALDNGPVNTTEFDTYALSTSKPVRFPLPEYPEWSYYSKYGEPCTHHSENCSYGNSFNDALCTCQHYGGAIQCVAFAKYASDQYAHKSSWSPVSGDLVRTVDISSSDGAKCFFADLSMGTYVSGTGHSFVIRHTTSSTVYTYECNASGRDCHISLEAHDYSKVYGTIGAIDIAYTHYFNGTPRSISSSCHMIPCTSSGCGGYEVEYHYSRNPGDKATCAVCGYVGKIDAGLLQRLTPQE